MKNKTNCEAGDKFVESNVFFADITAIVWKYHNSVLQSMLRYTLDIIYCCMQTNRQTVNSTKTGEKIRQGKCC